MTDRTVFGWRFYTWTKPAHRCQICRRKVRLGVINVDAAGRELEPDFKVVCRSCFYAMDDARPVEGL